MNLSRLWKICFDIPLGLLFAVTIIFTNRYLLIWLLVDNINQCLIRLLVKQLSLVGRRVEYVDEWPLTKTFLRLVLSDLFNLRLVKSLHGTLAFVDSLLCEWCLYSR